MARSKTVKTVISSRCDSPQCICAFQKLSKGLGNAINPDHLRLELHSKDSFSTHSLTKSRSDFDDKYHVKKQKLHEIFDVISKDSEVDEQGSSLESVGVFTPSRQLTRLISEHIERPDSKEAEAYNLIRKFYNIDALNRIEINELEKIISEEVEDFLVDWASLVDENLASKYLSKDGEFSREVYLNLIDRLQLKPSEAAPVLSLLYRELFSFARKGNQKRAWGQLRTENSDLVLYIKEGSFDIPEFDSLFL